MDYTYGVKWDTRGKMGHHCPILPLWTCLYCRAPTVREKPGKSGNSEITLRPLKVREFHTFYSKSRKSLWILYHLGSIRIIFVAVPTSALHICFSVLTVHSHHFCGPILRGASLTGPHYGLSPLDISFLKSLWYQCNFIAVRPTTRLRQLQLWGEESGV